MGCRLEMQLRGYGACLAGTKPWDPCLAPQKPGVAEHTYNPREVEPGGSEVKGGSHLYIEFEASL